MIKRSLLLAGYLLLEGCITFQPANYRPHYGNYSLLQAQPHCTVAVTEHHAVNAGIEKLSVRAAPFASPTGDGFSGFLAASLNEELEKGGIYAADPQRALTLSLEKNALDTPTGTGKVDIAILLTVVNSQTRAQVAQIPVQVHREWKSSFVGATAMNLAIGEYSEAVAELNGKLFVDPAFLKAIDCPATTAAASK